MPDEVQVTYAAQPPACAEHAARLAVIETRLEGIDDNTTEIRKNIGKMFDKIDGVITAHQRHEMWVYILPRVGPLIVLVVATIGGFIGGITKFLAKIVGVKLH